MDKNYLNNSFFRLQSTDNELNKKPEIKKYFRDCTKAILKEIKEKNIEEEIIESLKPKGE